MMLPTPRRDTLPLTLTESVFQERVLALARLTGWHIAHFRPAQARSGRWNTPMRGHTGYPDLTLARDGRVLFAELKSEKGRLTPEQRDWLNALNWHEPTAALAALHGDHSDTYAPEGTALATLWRPRDWPTITATLARPTRRPHPRQPARATRQESS